MEQYEHFCLVSRFLYTELEQAAAMVHMLKEQGLEYEFWEFRKQELLHRIKVHYNDFERILFYKEKGF